MRGWRAGRCIRWTERSGGSDDWDRCRHVRLHGHTNCVQVRCSGIPRVGAESASGELGAGSRARCHDWNKAMSVHAHQEWSSHWGYSLLLNRCVVETLFRSQMGAGGDRHPSKRRVSD
jgi:hypothetical protein